MVQNKTWLHLVAFGMACALAVIASLSSFADDVNIQTSEETEVVLETEISVEETHGTSEQSIEVVAYSDELQNGKKSQISDTGFDPNNIVSVDVVRSSNPVSPDNATGLKKLLLQLIGDYDMVTAEYTYTSSNGYTNKQVTTEPDYAWMITAALFIVVLWSLFRFVGGLACGRS